MLKVNKKFDTLLLQTCCNYINNKGSVGTSCKVSVLYTESKTVLCPYKIFGIFNTKIEATPLNTIVNSVRFVRPLIAWDIYLRFILSVH